MTGTVAQSVMSLIADTGIVSSIRANTFVEFDHEIFSIVILLLSVIQGILSVTSESVCTKYCLV